MVARGGLVLIFSLIALSTTGHAQDTLDLYPRQHGALVVWTESRTVPRPLKIYFLRVDLTCAGLELATFSGIDPDGNGPAESSLTPPTDLFDRGHALAAINANAFAGLPGTENDIRGWYANRAVDIQGMVVSNGRVISPVQKGRTPFWMDTHKHPHIGNPVAGDSVWQAVSDWSTPLLINGSIIPDSTTTTLHPRSGIGFDDTGKWLLFIVVDGRQAGFSEGMSLFELARLFQAQGCTQSINLDGGGSSIMLVRKPGMPVETVNRPSGKVHRPVPVMIGIK